MECANIEYLHYEDITQSNAMKLKESFMPYPWPSEQQNRILHTNYLSLYLL